MAANEALLGELHNVLTTQLLDRIKAGEATAADMAVARGLLKDNHITCIPKDDNAVGELQKKLAERRAKREAPKLAVVPSDDTQAAAEDAAFMMRQVGHG